MAIPRIKTNLAYDFHPWYCRAIRGVPLACKGPGRWSKLANSRSLSRPNGLFSQVGGQRNADEFLVVAREQATLGERWVTPPDRAAEGGAGRRHDVRPA